MKRAPRFPRLTGSAGLWTSEKPGFASLAQQSLGNAGSPADGVDGQLLGILGAFRSAGSLLDAISAAGAALQAADAATRAFRLPDLDAAIAAATAASSGSITRIGAALDLLTTSPTWTSGLGPAPVPPVIDPSVSAGGGGGGGTSPFTEATYAETTSVAATASIEGMAQAGLVSTAFAAEAAIVIPVIGIAIGVALLLVGFLGGGCGAPCVEGSKAEQIYEAAADDILAVFKLGMITAAQAVAIMAHLIAAGQQHLAGFNTPQANKGADNMQKVIQAEIADVAEAKPAKATPLNLTEAHLHYVQGPGWYPDSLVAAGQLADEYLQALTPAKGA